MEMSILLPEAHKFLVVILYTSSAEEVATVSENWRVDQDVMFYPNFKGPKLEKAVRSHQTPDSNWPSYPYMLLKICGKFSVGIIVARIHLNLTINYTLCYFIYFDR